MSSPPNPPGGAFTLDSMITALVGQDVRNRLRQNAIARGNTPNLAAWVPTQTPNDHRLRPGLQWITDRIIEPQTIAHFVESQLDHSLPGGGVPSAPRILREDVQLIFQPYATWAPQSFLARPSIIPNEAPIGGIMKCIGSFDYPQFCKLVAKDLHAFKSRIWEGIMPLSARRWREKQLDNLDNFATACQFLSMAITTFLYLNNSAMTPLRRNAYNLIYMELTKYENGLRARGAPEGEILRSSMTWEEFMRAHYAVMVNRTHAWVMEHVDRLKAIVLDKLATHQPLPGSNFDEEQWALTNIWQDLTEITSQADYAILMTMEGYRGADPLSASPNYDFQTQKLSVKPDLNQRAREYHLRRKHLTMTALMTGQFVGFLTGQPPMSSLNSPTEIVQRCREQDLAQKMVREELRGEPVTYETEPWLRHTHEGVQWGFVACRACPSFSDAEWDEFEKRFEADVADWGEGIAGVESLKARSKIHWIDAKDLGIEHEDTTINKLRSAFRAFRETEEFPKTLREDLVLVADDASVSSYLHPKPLPEYSRPPPGDDGGSIPAADAGYDPEQEEDDESPGYKGELRVLGSLLWDDISAMLCAQNQFLTDLWPLAKHHPRQVYVGPVVTTQKRAWAACQ